MLVLRPRRRLIPLSLPVRRKACPAFLGFLNKLKGLPELRFGVLDHAGRFFFRKLHHVDRVTIASSYLLRLSQPVLQEHDGLEGWAASGEEPARKKFIVGSSEPGSDIGFHLWTDEGWLCLVIVLVLFNRELIGWSVKPHIPADFVTNAMTVTEYCRRPAPGLMHHSDRGSDYATHTVQDKLKSSGMTFSMSRKGNC